MSEICEKHNVLKRSCYICELEKENQEMKEFIQWAVDISLDKRIAEQGKKLLKSL